MAAQPWLATLVLPLLPIVKFIRTVCILLRLQPETILHRPLLLPPLLLGLIFWGIGFAKGVHEGGPAVISAGENIQRLPSSARPTTGLIKVKTTVEHESGLD